MDTLYAPPPFTHTLVIVDLLFAVIIYFFRYALLIRNQTVARFSALHYIDRLRYTVIPRRDSVTGVASGFCWLLYAVTVGCIALQYNLLYALGYLVLRPFAVLALTTGLYVYRIMRYASIRPSGLPRLRSNQANRTDELLLAILFICGVVGVLAIGGFRIQQAIADKDYRDPVSLIGWALGAIVVAIFITALIVQARTRDRRRKSRHK